jgi:hypothetical protein
MRPVMIHPRPLRAFARLALAVLCVHAAQPLAAGLNAAHAPPAALDLCTAAGFGPVTSREESPAPRKATQQHCVLCLVGGDVASPPATGAPVPATVRIPLLQRASATGPGADVPRPEARGPPRSSLG